MKSYIPSIISFALAAVLFFVHKKGYIKDNTLDNLDKYASILSLCFSIIYSVYTFSMDNISKPSDTQGNNSSNNSAQGNNNNQQRDGSGNIIIGDGNIVNAGPQINTSTEMPKITEVSSTNVVSSESIREQCDDAITSKRYGEAVEYCTRLIEMDQGSYYGYYQRGYSHMKNDEWDMAINDFTKSASLKETPSVYYNRGLTYRNSKLDIQKSIDDFTKAIEYKPDFIANLYYNRGISFELLNKYEDARDDYKECKKSNPSGEILSACNEKISSVAMKIPQMLLWQSDFEDNTTQGWKTFPETILSIVSEGENSLYSLVIKNDNTNMSTALTIPDSFAGKEATLHIMVKNVSNETLPFQLRGYNGEKLPNGSYDNQQCHRLSLQPDSSWHEIILNYKFDESGKLRAMLDLYTPGLLYVDRIWLQQEPNIEGDYQGC
jgi:tetratricopeptide (TPR) repeat protein